MLSNAGPGVTSNGIDTRSISYNFNQMRFSAVGTFAAQGVVIEHSPDGGATWIALTPAGGMASGSDLLVDAPVDLVRARTVAGQTGTASVYLLASM